jgi:hypothetical protein
MNPRDKALDLQHRMKDCLYSDGLFDAKQCALVCIKEILQVIPMYIGNLNPTWKYWNEVKEELLKL